MTMMDFEWLSPEDQVPEIKFHEWRPDHPVMVRSQKHGELIAMPTKYEKKADGDREINPEGAVTWLCKHPFHDMEGEFLEDVTGWRPIHSSTVVVPT